MDSSLSSIQNLVKKIKREMFSKPSLVHLSISPSAYDTAWLAMIPDPHTPGLPMFTGCLDWILNNQSEGGFWGEVNGDGLPTIDTLPATLACMLALKEWNVGFRHIEKGLAFIQSNTKMILGMNHQHLPRWFVMVFPGMVELAQLSGLELDFPDNLKAVIFSIIYDRQRILETEELVDKYQSLPILSYLEALPSNYEIDQEDIVSHLSPNGSLFQSPSATAFAFMDTGNQKCKNYLDCLVEIFIGGVPAVYPLDEELINLCMVNQIERLGLAEYFNEEIEDVLARVYRSCKDQASGSKEINSLPTKIFKDSLAFRLLRMHGYDISPGTFCWFLRQEDLLDYIEQNCEYFTSTVYNVYRAGDLMFPGECELEEAMSFSKKLLKKAMTLKNKHDNIFTFPGIWRAIEHEMSLPWMARMEHLDHRMWIEGNKASPIWIGKASSYRLSCLHNETLMQLAVENYQFRQSIYRNELEELKRWSKETGLSEMGFGREKTTYCYFATATSNVLPCDSAIRMIVSKSAIVVTVADDFFDMQGSLDQLQCLTEAVQRWDAQGLSGPGKIIFDALDNVVGDIAAEYLRQQGRDITTCLRNIWHETFAAWLMESTWSKTGYIPTTDEYIKTGMTSIATHTLVLPASCFLSQASPNYHAFKATQNENVTKLLMFIPRLLNDIQSYEKEEKDGRKNFVLLHMKENPGTKIEDSITYIQTLLDEKKKEFLKHVLMDGTSDMPKPCKHLHLSCLKVFQMFFNSTNRYDSETDLVSDIKNAIYVPVEYDASKPVLPLPSLPRRQKRDTTTTIKVCYGQKFSKHGSRRLAICQLVPRTIPKIVHRKLMAPPTQLKSCFV